MTHPDIRETDLAWLSSLAHALVHEPHAADDLVQDTVLAATQTPGPLHHPRAFLASVARRLSARKARTEVRRRRREQIAARDERVADSAELIERAEVAERVARAARTLDEPFRTTVLAHYLDGASVAEIARREGRPADTIRWRLRQGIERLRAKLVQEDGRSWSEWSVLLLPLARVHERAVAGLTAAASGGSATTTLIVFMKAQGSIALTAIVIAVACAMLWFESPSSLPPSTLNVASDDATHTSVVDMPVVAPEVAARPAQEPSPQAVRTQASAATAPIADGRWAILVVDPSREPIPDARVDLVEIQPADKANGKRAQIRLHRSERSDEDGVVRFARPQNAERFGIVANADGRLRTAVAPPAALVEDASTPLVVVLQPGNELRGRVVDLRGRPVPNLRLLALTPGFGVSHVCLSSVGLRAENRFQDPRNAEYQQSRATTATDGSVTFDGVPALAELVIRSDDPTWRLVKARRVAGDAPFVTWTAAPAFGVVVRVLDTYGRRPVRAAATFAVDLDLADGSRKPVGQWVGKGNGTLRFSFDDELFPPLDELDVVRATFHGTITTSAGTKSWRADPIQNPQAGGLAELEVLVEPAALTDSSLDSTPKLPLVLDVLDGNGQPHAGPLLVRWSSATTSSKSRGKTRAKMERPGTYRADVPVPADIDDIAVVVQPSNASGSVSSWSKTLRAIPDREQILQVRLAPAGDVTILRPSGWSKAWSVHASYRQSPGEPWRGSWNYGTSDDRLNLRALLPAEWRFELTQDSPTRTRTLEVTVDVGNQLVVGG